MVALPSHEQLDRVTSVLLPSLVILMVGVAFYWWPLHSFVRPNSDEVLSLSLTYEQYMESWQSRFGFYRWLSVAFHLFLVKLLSEVHGKIFFVLLLEITHIVLFILAALRCLRIDIRWFPYVLSLVFLSPFWLRGGLNLPALANELHAGLFSATFLWIVTWREYGRVEETLLTIGYLAFSAFIYASHLPITMAILLVSGRVRIPSVLFPSLLFVLFRIVVLKYDVVFSDPKIVSQLALSLNKSYLEYITSKWSQFVFLLQDFDPILAMKMAPVLILIVVVFRPWKMFVSGGGEIGLSALTLEFNGISEGRQSWFRSPLLLPVVSGGGPAVQIFFAETLLSGGVSWSFLTNFTIGATLSAILFYGKSPFFRWSVIFLALIAVAFLANHVDSLAFAIQEGDMHMVRNTFFHRLVTVNRMF